MRLASRCEPIAAMEGKGRKSLFRIGRPGAPSVLSVEKALRILELLRPFSHCKAVKGLAFYGIPKGIILHKLNSG